MDEQGRLLLVSDLEGCAPYDSKQEPQSQQLCSPEFFTSVATFLEWPKNKVAFLGDYFDKGPFVVDTINGIMTLKELYKERVHIILGNRDLNKMRLIYEMKESPQAVGENKWAEWSKFYNDLNPTPSLSISDRLLHILNTSMGAPGPIQISPKDELTQEEAGFLLLSAFSIPNATLLPNSQKSKAKLLSHPEGKYTRFIENVRKLFTEGKILIYDTDFKTLLSHAGGMDPFILHNVDYYTNIKAQLLPRNGQALTYYDKIEQVRLLLQKPPTPIQQDDRFHDYTYNAPLACISTLFDDQRSEPPDDFFLIQGLGLKPNPGEHFTSFIQSCDILGCKGPSGPDFPLNPDISLDKYLKFLESSGVKVIAFGHVPHCTPVPLIYRRPESQIIFIANDTSNGYRPFTIKAINEIPLGYVSYTQTGEPLAGVFSLPGNTEHTYDGEGVLENMVYTWSIESCPMFRLDPPRIQYPGGKALLFPARKEIAPPGIFTPSKMEGGIRRKPLNRVTKRVKTKHKKNRRKTRK